MAEEQQTKTIFEVLNHIDVSDRSKKKMGLTYLSWADAWGILKEKYPQATYKIYTRTTHTTHTNTQEITEADGTKITSVTVIDDGEQEIPYFTDGNTVFVKVGVIIDGIEETETYPVLDLKNSAVKLRNVDMALVNKALQRAFVKACGRWGLGLYIYRGEDLPIDNEPQPEPNRDDFNAVKGQVINLAAKLLKDNTKAAEVARYIKEVFQGVKLSETTEDKHKTQIQQAYDYFKSL